MRTGVECSVCASRPNDSVTQGRRQGLRLTGSVGGAVDVVGSFTEQEVSNTWCPGPIGIDMSLGMGTLKKAA